VKVGAEARSAHLASGIRSRRQTLISRNAAEARRIGSNWKSSATTRSLRMSAGARFPTVVAKPVGEGVATVMETRADRDTETVLRAVSQTQGASPTDLARSLGWTYGNRHEASTSQSRGSSAIQPGMS
jgi:hypothetical protein